MSNDIFNARGTLAANQRTYTIYRLKRLEEAGLINLGHLPYSIRVLLEAVLRQCDGREITKDARCFR